MSTPQPPGSLPSVAAGGSHSRVNTIYDVSDQFLGELKLWLEAVGLSTPISQVRGFSQFTGVYAREDSEAHRATAGFGDPDVSGSAGPTITGLPDGRYSLQFGGSGTGTLSGNVVAYMGLSVNGSTPVVGDACEAQGTAHYSVARTILANLTNGGNNTVKALYATSDGTDRGDFRYRWVLAQRYANV